MEFKQGTKGRSSDVDVVEVDVDVEFDFNEDVRGGVKMRGGGELVIGIE